MFIFVNQKETNHVMFPLTKQCTVLFSVMQKNTLLFLALISIYSYSVPLIRQTMKQSDVISTDINHWLTYLTPILFTVFAIPKQLIFLELVETLLISNIVLVMVLFHLHQDIFIFTQYDEYSYLLYG